MEQDAPAVNAAETSQKWAVIARRVLTVPELLLGFAHTWCTMLLR